MLIKEGSGRARPPFIHIKYNVKNIENSGEVTPRLRLEDVKCHMSGSVPRW